MARLAWTLFFAALCSCATAGSDDGDPPDAPLPTTDATAVDAPVVDARPIDAGPIDAMPGQFSIRHDVAVDFAGPGTVEGAAGVTRFGTVAPMGYFRGGLLAHGSDTGVFTDPANTTWATILAMPWSASRSVARLMYIDWGATTPAGLGLTQGDDFTQRWEGEIYLDAGAYTFYLLADDHGFVELAEPYGASYTRVLSANWPTEASGAYTAATSGWYPVRVALCEQTGSTQARLRYSFQGGPMLDIPPYRLRFRADDLQGWYMAGWDDIYAVGSHNIRLDQSAPANQDWGSGAPADLGLSDADYFSVRWAGQYFIGISGSYTFRLATDDGQRLWIDGVRQFDNWDNSTHDNTTGPISLTRGWHDFVVDQTEAAGSARAALTVVSGPEGAGAAVALARTRPAIGRGERYDTGVDRTDRAIPDQGQTESVVVLSAPAGVSVTGVDVSWTFSHSYWGDLEVRLITPSGLSVLLRNRVGGSSSGTATDRVYTTALNNVAVAGAWTLRVSDAAGGDTGTLQDVQLTVHYAGGESPTPLASYFESPVLSLGPRTTSLDTLSWAQEAPTGTSVIMSVRTGATAQECQAAAWSGPYTTPAGSSLSGVAPAAFAQYRIDFTSDGVLEPAVDWVQLDYSGY